MSLWLLTENSRFQHERKEIEHLQATEKWLVGVIWSLEGHLVVQADIEIDGDVYEVKLTYPDFFPATPPYVMPVNLEDRWSTHQYASGILCLEWGPDNWNPEITGELC